MDYMYIYDIRPLKRKTKIIWSPFSKPSVNTSCWNNFMAACPYMKTNDKWHESEDLMTEIIANGPFEFRPLSRLSFQRCRKTYTRRLYLQNAKSIRSRLALLFTKPSKAHVMSKLIHESVMGTSLHHEHKCCRYWVILSNVGKLHWRM